jgi:ABC-type transport system involved in multi-copper enzyme maturation permease subunit
MLSKLLSVAHNCFTETIRQPIFMAILLTTVLLMVANVALAGYTLDDDNKLLKDLGLSTLLMSGLFLAAFSATGVVTREIENKTVLTVISKPIGRPVFLLGKFFGLAAALAVFNYLNTIVFLMCVRHRVMERSSQHRDWPVILFGVGAGFLCLLLAGFANYFYRKHFTSTFMNLILPLMTLAILLIALIDPEWKIQSFGKDFLDGQILSAIFLVFLALLVIMAIAVAASTRLGQVMTLAICAGVLLIGLVSDYIFGLRADQHLLARLAYWVAPNIAFLWVTDAITQNNPIPLSYVGIASLYALAYMAAAMCLAIALFQKREVG